MVVKVTAQVSDGRPVHYTSLMSHGSGWQKSEAEGQWQKLSDLVA